MTLSRLSTKIDLIWINYARIMTNSSKSLSNYFVNVLMLQIAFWGVNIIMGVMTGTVMNIGEFLLQKVLTIPMVFFCVKKEIKKKKKKELGPFPPSEE